MAHDPSAEPALRYAYQQIEQFQKLGEVFMMQHTHTAEMDQEYAAFKEAFIRSLSPEERLAGLSPEDEDYAALKEAFLGSLSPDERVTGLAPEDRLAGLSAEDIRRMIAMLLRGTPPHDLVQLLPEEERRRIFEELCREGYTPPET